ncbi:hypothetical protein J6590_011010 [Homalodisca vitripennis]|nr:hypothetical protein J6590_011010 [Homalodisca vitripennis]
MDTQSFNQLSIPPHYIRHIPDWHTLVAALHHLIGGDFTTNYLRGEFIVTKTSIPNYCTIQACLTERNASFSTTVVFSQLPPFATAEAIRDACIYKLLFAPIESHLVPFNATTDNSPYMGNSTLTIRVTDTCGICRQGTSGWCDQTALDKDCCNLQDPDWLGGLRFSCSLSSSITNSTKLLFTPRAYGHPSPTPALCGTIRWMPPP